MYKAIYRHRPFLASKTTYSAISVDLPTLSVKSLSSTECSYYQVRCLDLDFFFIVYFSFDSLIMIDLFGYG